MLTFTATREGGEAAERPAEGGGVVVAAGGGSLLLFDSHKSVCVCASVENAIGELS